MTFVVRTFDLGLRAEIDPDRIHRLLDEIDVAIALAKLRD